MRLGFPPTRCRLQCAPWPPSKPNLPRTEVRDGRRAELDAVTDADAALMLSRPDTWDGAGPRAVRGKRRKPVLSPPRTPDHAATVPASRCSHCGAGTRCVAIDDMGARREGGVPWPFLSEALGRILNSRISSWCVVFIPITAISR
jgi:hypothetical protein